MTSLVLHRLALGVEVVDAVTGRVVDVPVQVAREVPRALRRRQPVVALPLEASGTGRYRLRHDLRHGPPPPQPLVVRVDDPRRRFVPRRLAVPLWTLPEIEAAETAGGHVPVRARLLRPRLLPGSAYALPHGTTGLRGQVHHIGRPLPWARVEARIGPDGDEQVVGRAHGDERGEFLLIVTTLGDLDRSLPDEVDLRVVVLGPNPVAPAAGADDQEEDNGEQPTGPPAEPVPRTPDRPPPADTDLDTPLLRGEIPPPGYRESSVGRRITVTVGRVRREPTPFPFSP
ncbi:hypothetical protein [Streptomyces sp. NPDC007940]|uniref:hypothetical protein n=1 Tax=Streptomyces sp. NPDC007940 TaxID=3364796 RepID=UPI0036EFB1E8